jgi:hypothetical protein
VIRELLARSIDHVTHTFLRLAVPLDSSDEEIQQRWKRALGTLHDLDLTYAWGSRQKRARFRALAADPVMLAAIQGTVAHCTNVRIDWLAVLVADGSAASYDALVPHIDAAVVGCDGRLDRLRQLRTHAVDTATLRTLFAEIDDTLAARHAASPALALADRLGIGPVTTLRFRTWLWSRGPGVPPVQGAVEIDSTHARWFHLYLIVSNSGARTTLENDVVTADGLGLGPCELHHLPGWISRASRTLDVQWQPFRVTTNLQGRKRAALLGWLEEANKP